MPADRYIPQAPADENLVADHGITARPSVTEEDPRRSAATVPEGVPELLTDLASKVLATKEGETFLYSDTEGNLDDRKEFGLGLYHRDTRFLSHYRMKLSGRDPVLLSSSGERGYMSSRRPHEPRPVRRTTSSPCRSRR